MAENVSERRLVVNQVFFKEKNQKVPEGLDKLKAEAVAEGHDVLVQNLDVPLEFYCECSDENCGKRITLKPSEYKELHQNSAQFIILPGHNTPSVERIVTSSKKFVVVEKYRTPPKNVDKPNPTNLDYK